ncbi:hypothetical protein ZWY2020_055743 [Hordeum vulgare]|nr:hypothetical protein ZWY2020_055743 [Hordeum vulgare]
MAGRSKKAKQDDPPVASHDEVASHGNEEQQSQGRRNRASPARLFKLNKDLNFEQKGAIIEKEFGGLLDLAANSMSGDLSQWIMRHYDPEMSQIVIPARGKNPVDAASVRRIWGLPNRGRKKQKKLTGMVHVMCSVISHAVGKLVSGFGRIDDDEWGARTTNPDDVETSRRESKRRRQQVPVGTDSLPSDEESFISDDDGSEEDHTENDEVSEDKDNDGSEEDGSSDNDDGDKVGTSVHMGREVEIDGNKDKEDEEEGKEDDDDDEGDDSKEEKEDDEGDDNDEEKEDDEGDDNEEQKEDDEQGDDEDDDDDNGGNSGSGDNGASGSNGGSGDNDGSGGNDGSGKTPPSVDDEQCTLQFLFVKRRHNKKKKSLDEADSICVRDLVMTDLKTAASPTPCFSLFEVREMLDIEDRSLTLEAKRIFEELLSAKDLDLPFTFYPEEICPKEIRRKVMREIGSALEVGEPKQFGQNQVPPPPFTKKKKKSVSFILETTVMNETGGNPQTFRSENNKYGQGGKARQPIMKKFGASQQQYEAISEVKEASNGIDETQLLNNMLPSSVSPGLASKQTGKQASCTQVMATQSKQEASPTAFQPSLAEATLNATRVEPIQVKKGGNTLSVSKAKPGATQPLGDLTCQLPFSSRGNVKQVGNAFQRGKVQDLKASPQDVLLNDAGQEKEEANIPPAVSCMEIKREQDKIAETKTNISEQKLLTTHREIACMFNCTCQT